ncbi:helix-turn-helix domain-containing protein [Streptomyces virginiae]|uniref:helix-turn-helix domain-containing protein n=1 Tax=Streptomyces virginiae TaxID=1961 RepID=UPI0035D5CCFA
MGRRPSRLNPNNPVEAFALELRALRDAAGPAGTVTATCRAAGITRTTYYAWLSGKQLPGRDALERVVRPWGGDIAYWLERRRRAEEEAGSPTDRPRPRRGAAAQEDDTATAEPGPTPSDLFVPSDKVIELWKSSQQKSLREARDLLLHLGYTGQQRGQLATYTILTLSGINPGRSWSDAFNPTLRAVEILQFIQSQYAKEYAANTREALRRSILHPFIEDRLVVVNPDMPDRPINSPKWCYRLSDRALDLVRKNGQRGFWADLRQYHEWRLQKP